MVTHYDVHDKIKIIAEALVYIASLGAVLLQSQDGATWQPVVFSLYSLNETELNHAQIEKEVLALVYTCEKFPLDYALSLNTVVLT